MQYGSGLLRVKRFQRDIAEREKNMAEIKKKKTLDAEHLTALINRNTAILNYNRVVRAGNTITIPPLPTLNYMQFSHRNSP